MSSEPLYTTTLCVDVHHKYKPGDVLQKKQLRVEPVGFDRLPKRVRITDIVMANLNEELPRSNRFCPEYVTETEFVDGIWATAPQSFGWIDQFYEPIPTSNPNLEAVTP